MTAKKYLYSSRFSQGETKYFKVRKLMPCRSELLISVDSFFHVNDLQTYLVLKKFFD